ncbi:MAG TPA: hypothetical protein VFY49_07030, partial [Myxococcota bacterium]|nr:hypothetical protein [Myxococcota bacterium]
AADGGWVLSQRDESPDQGYALYRRQAPGEDFASWRLETELAAAPELVERVTLRNLVEGGGAAGDHKKQLLRREGRVVWVHVDIPIALAADRDAVFRIERSRDSATGGLRIDWRADPEAGPPPKEGIVRMRVSHGYWLFTSAAGGRTHVLYESYAEPGGPFPSWLVDVISSNEVMGVLVHLRGSLAEAVSLPAVSADDAQGG